MNEAGRNVPHPDTLDNPEVLARKELAELGIEANRENVEAVIEQKGVRQHPEGHEDIINSLNDPTALKAAMERLGIRSVVHAEGTSVWDHAKTAIRRVDSLDLPDALKHELRILMLYHDLGKAEVMDEDQNLKATEKNLKKGILLRNAIGHAEARGGDIRKGLAANGLTGERLETLMTIVRNHMNTSLLEQSPKKTVALFETFGSDDDERRETVRLLTTILQIDAQATEHIDLEEGELKYSKNERKSQLDFAAVWAKYEEGLELVHQEAAKQEAKKAEAAREAAIFGGKLSDYLIKERGIKPGPEMGRAVGQVKKLLAEQSDRPPEEVRRLVDGMEF